MSDDFRSMVSDAYNEAEAASTDTPATPTETVDATPVPQADVAPNATEAAPVETADKTAMSSSRTRDASGKFAKGKTAATSVSPAPKQGAESVTGSPASTPAVSPTTEGAASIEATPDLKAPQSWRPAAREEWAKLPLSVRQEAVRIDQEVRKTMQEAAPAKKHQQEFNQAMAPYESLFRETGVSPVQAAQAVLQTVQQLRTSGPQARAAIFANLLKSYPTDIEALAKAIDGQAPTPGAPQQLDPSALVAQVTQQVRQSIVAERTEAAKAKIAQEIEAFANDPKNKWFNDVWPDMVPLLQAKPDLTLEQAYKKACRANDDVWDIMQKAQAAEAGKALTASTQQAKNAALSVKSTPSTGASSRPTPKSHRDIVAAVWDELDGR